MPIIVIFERIFSVSPKIESSIFNDIVFLAVDGYKLISKLLDFNEYDGLVIADELVADGIQMALIEKKMNCE